MKPFKFLIPVIAILLALTGGVVYALYSAIIPSHVRIIQAPPPPSVLLSFWQDEQCAQPATFVEWNDMLRGAVQTKDMFWVRNDSTVTVTVTGSSSLPVGVGTLPVTFKKGATYEPTVQMAIGEVVRVRGLLTIDAGAPLGDVSFNIIMGAQ